MSMRTIVTLGRAWSPGEGCDPIAWAMAYRSEVPRSWSSSSRRGGERDVTADRAKPAVPFGGIYRLIDFALSNVVNSGYLKIVVLTSTSRTASTGTSPRLADVDDARQLRR